jgi:hypothetical protein
MPLLRRLFQERLLRRLGWEPGVVDQNVDRTQVGGARSHGLNVSDVEGRGPAAEALGYSISPLLVDIVDDDVSTAFREHFQDFQGVPLTASGHERDLLIQLKHVGSFLNG